MSDEDDTPLALVIPGNAKLSPEVISSLPQWAQAQAEFFTAHFMAPGVLSKWVAFEVLMVGSALEDVLLGCVSRPPEVAMWKKEHRIIHKVPSVKVGEYALLWIDWYISLNESWRTQGRGTLPLPRDVPKDATWKSLRKGGPNGIFILILSLYWWFCAVKHDEEARKVYLTAVEDVEWVLGQLVALGPPPSASQSSGTKRKRTTPSARTPLRRVKRR